MLDELDVTVVLLVSALHRAFAASFEHLNEFPDSSGNEQSESVK